MTIRRGETRAQANRRIRQDALREQLAAQKHHEHLSEIAHKLLDLGEDELDSVEVQRLKAAADIKRTLIGKYLPDLKATEHTGPDGGPMEHEHSISVEYAKPNHTDS